MQHFISCRKYMLIKINLKVETIDKRWRLYIIPVHFIKSRFQHCWMVTFEEFFLEISCIMVTGYSSDQRFASYFIPLNAQEQKFDESLTSQRKDSTAQTLPKRNLIFWFHNHHHHPSYKISDLDLPPSEKKKLYDVIYRLPELICLKFLAFML